MVGDFGDGHIFGFNSGVLAVNILLDTTGNPVTLRVLWSLTFGGAAASNPDTLFFSQSVAKGTHGLFGSCSPVGPVTGP